MIAKPLKPKRCKHCREIFTPTKPLQSCCSVPCAIAYSQHSRANAERIAQIADRKTIKKKLEKLKTARDWTKEAQIAFNAFIRKRDKDKPCICCGRHLELSGVGGGFDCGHYRSVGSAPHLRFDERNAHGQRKQCNRYGAGRAVDYRIGLIARIGIDSVEALERDQTPRKYTIDELKAIKAHFVAKIKEMDDQRGGGKRPEELLIWPNFALELLVVRKLKAYWARKDVDVNRIVYDTDHTAT